MKVGIRKPSLKKSISARTTGRAKRAVKRAVIPGYGKKGMGWIKDPKKAAYNKAYHKTTVSVVPKVPSGSGKSTKKRAKRANTYAANVNETPKMEYGPSIWRVLYVIGVIMAVLGVILLLASPGAGVAALVIAFFEIHSARKNLRQIKEKETEERELRRRHPTAIPDVTPSRIVCYDLETTGLKVNERDEILSVSFIDGVGNTLLHTLVKPEHRRKWDDAQAVNGISPEMVRGCPKFPAIAEQVQSILDHADLIIGYNILKFDNDFLRAKGITVDDSKCWDVMLEFSERYTDWNEKYGNRRWVKLTQAAQKFGCTFDAHDALEDARATLYVFNEIKIDDIKRGLDGYGDSGISDMC